MTRSPETSQAIFEDVKAVVVVTLDIEDQADDIGLETGLYGNLPELDSLTVVKLIVALRKRFGIEIKMEEIVGDIFETLGRLAAFVESKVRWQRPSGVDYTEGERSGFGWLSTLAEPPITPTEAAAPSVRGTITPASRGGGAP